MTKIQRKTIAQIALTLLEMDGTIDYWLRSEINEAVNRATVAVLGPDECINTLASITKETNKIKEAIFHVRHGIEDKEK